MWCWDRAEAPEVATWAQNTALTGLIGARLRVSTSLIGLFFQVKLVEGAVEIQRRAKETSTCIPLELFLS